MNTHKFPCFYPLFSLPPSTFHFNTAVVLSQHEEIGTVYVILPAIKYDFIDQDQCIELFKAYGSSHPMMEISVEKSQFENPLEDIENRFKQDPNLMAYVALTEDDARSDQFDKMFQHDNVQIELVPSNFEGVSKKMIKAIETGDKKNFLQYVPKNLTPQQKEDCWDIVHSEVNEEIVSSRFWKKVITEIFDESCDYFDTSTTGMPNYDAMLERPSYYYFFKDQTISLKYMTPEEYMQLCATNVHDTTVDQEYKSVDIPDVKALIDAMESEQKIDTPVLNVSDKSQEGRHRCMAAAKLGCTKVPVYVVANVHAGKQKDAINIVNKAKDYSDAKKELIKIGVPLDEKTYDKVKWKEYKLDTEK